MEGNETPTNSSPVGSDDNLSPRGLSRFNRLRRSFRKDSKKLKKLEQENAELRDKLQDASQELARLRNRLSEVATKQYVNVRNLQIGNNCTMKTGVNPDDLEETINGMEDLMTHLTDALEKDIKERANEAMETERVKIQLKEMKQLLVEQSNKLHTHTEADTRVLGDIKALLEELQNDRPDINVFSDCLSALKRQGQQRIVDGYESLPPNARPGIIRLVNKYGDYPWKDFALKINLEPQTVRSYKADVDCYPQASTAAAKLDKDICSMIMAEWAKPHENDTNMFMHYIERIHQCELAAIQSRYRKDITGSAPAGRQYQRSFPRTCSTESVTTTVTTRTEHVRSAEVQFSEDQCKLLKRMLGYVKGLPEIECLLKDIKAKVEDVHEINVGKGKWVEDYV